MPQITFEVDGPWFAVQAVDGFFDIQQDVGSPDVMAVQFSRPTAVYGADDTPVDLAEASAAAAILRQNASIKVVNPRVVTIDGRAGQELTVDYAMGKSAPVIRVAAGPISILPGRRLRLVFVDTDVGVVAILVGGSVVRWEEALAVAGPVLESVLIS